MKFTANNATGSAEILAADDFVAIPIKVTETGVVKAGTPLTDAGKKTGDGSGAAGILLYDVDVAVNPNAAMVVQGVINQRNAEEHAGVTYDASALKTALPGIVLRNNIGVNA